MAVYVVTGTLGSGKSLVCMGKARDYLWSGRPVATNVNIRVENLVSAKAPRDIRRIPDHPSAEFLWDGLGMGGESKDESTFGCLLLDEVGTWLNSREWKGSDRQHIIEWFIHSRKRRWDCYLVAQSVNMIDKQIREAIAEHVVICSRIDRIGVWGLSWLVEQFGGKLRLPQIHLAKVYYTAGRSLASAHKVATWMYSGRDLWGSYDTGQRFSAENSGVASMLSPHAYPWLAKPTSAWLSFLETCRQRGWVRLEKLAELLHQETPSERSWRLLQLWEEYGNQLTRPFPPSFQEWCSLQGDAGSFATPG